MQQKVKLSKRQIKEDKFTSFMLNAKSQLMGNWQFYIIGLVVAVIVVAGAVYVSDYQARRQTESAEKFARAMMASQSGQTQVALVSLNEIIDDYGDEKVAEEATYMLGKMNQNTSNYAEAIRYYELYTTNYNSNPRQKAAAYAGVGACYENQGDLVGAQSAYLKAYQALPEGPLAADYELSILRVALKNNDTTAAKERLESIKANWAGSDYENLALRLASEYNLL